MKNYIFNNRVASFFAIILSVFFVVSAVQAATTISTDISTGGALTVTGASTLYSTLTLPNIVATSTTATSTFAGGFAVNTSGLVYDYQTGKVGIGTASPAVSLDIKGTSQTQINLEASAAAAGIQMTSYRNSAITQTYIYGLASRGTKASPLAVHADDNLFSIIANGYGTTGFANSNDDVAQIDLAADANFTDTVAAGKIVFSTMKAGDTFKTVRMVIDSVGRVGIGLTSTAASLQVASSTANATSTLEVGRTGQSKGTCLALYDVTGTAVYVTFAGGALVVSATSCR